MWARSPLQAPFVTPDHYFLSVTTHGVWMAYVLTTFFIMGFGYFTAETSLERPLPGKPWAWLGFILGIAGTVMATVAILSGRASVLTLFIRL
jgi:cytochrome c oxidase subunit 1